MPPLLLLLLVLVLVLVLVLLVRCSCCVQVAGTFQLTRGEWHRG